MKNCLLLPLMLLVLLSCQNNGQPTIPDESELLAEVGTFRVTEQYLTTYLNSKGIQQPSSQQKDQALDEIIKQLALAHQANQNGLGLSIEQQLQLEQGRHRALAQAAMDQYILDKPVTEEEIKAEYERVTAELKGEEYRVHHMLFQDEVKAIEALDQIQQGVDYLTAEQTYLASLTNPKNVGDIGWVNIMQVPEVFRQPLQTMQPAQVHPKPLVSQFGVHVLYLADKRPLVAPDFETVKAGIKQSLERNKLDRYQQLAVIKAKAKVKDPKK